MPIRIAATQSRPARSRVGFTLVELVAVMAIIGIIAAVVALFMRDPVRAYVDTARRGELSDVADTALRRMARDIRSALPNSIRVTPSAGTPVHLELLLTKTGGRYRAQRDNVSAGDELLFSTTDTSFDTLGPMSALTGQTVADGDLLVVHNLFAAAAQTESNAYTYNSATFMGNNVVRLGTTAGGSLPNATKIRFRNPGGIALNMQFPLQSPGNRFHVVSGPVTYRCAPAGPDANGNGTGMLERISGYAIALAQPAPPVGSSGVLAGNVTACNIQYDQLVLTQNHGIVSIQLSITRGGETVSLYHEVHVSNVP